MRSIPSRQRWQKLQIKMKAFYRLEEDIIEKAKMERLALELYTTIQSEEHNLHPDSETLATMDMEWKRMISQLSILFYKDDYYLTQAIIRRERRRGNNGFSNIHGALFVLWIWICSDFIMETHEDQVWQPIMTLYRSLAILLFLQWLWNFQCRIWNKYNIPYRPLLGLSPTTLAQEERSDITQHTMVYLINLLFYSKSLRGSLQLGLPVYIYPLLLITYVLYQILGSCPTSPLWKLIGKVLLSPFSTVSFAEIYVGDVMTSLVRVFGDLAWSVCYVISGEFYSHENETLGHDSCSENKTMRNIILPILYALPLYLRCAQNLRCYLLSKEPVHLANAFKYALAESVLVFGLLHAPHKEEHNDDSTFHTVWIIAFVLATLYQFWWDVFMDWRFFPKPILSISLRPTRLYPYRCVYYLAIGIDFVLRFGWTLSLIPVRSGSPLGMKIQLYLSPVLATVEVFRRCMWGLFRMESEAIQRRLPTPNSSCDEISNIVSL